ncbi:hypothetical protein MtrunA17_Chr3g0135591 [Medicago truncatula]|uniref:Transmembrane protein, putative n=1 Tax=Medicago truncatula TaxID=3880 RepID=G7J7K3_MEDTR|nr:transmembrane protein, putative [Medicago truncatula]RHN70438.1 hypothetical protein MtrunA17_Chr3g0135521 [Medicago truncatula]RHN70445.1 hypothetical protein MtrunA17_Chr3g0135591 [Medicago truncatula]
MKDFHVMCFHLSFGLGCHQQIISHHHFMHLLPSSSSHELSSFSNHLQRLRSLWVDCNSECQLSLDAKNILDALIATVFKDLESIATTSQLSNMTTSTVSGSKYSFKSLLIQIFFVDIHSLCLHLYACLCVYHLIHLNSLVYMSINNTRKSTQQFAKGVKYLKI